VNDWKKQIAKLLQPGDTTKAVRMAYKLAKRRNPDEVAACLIELGIVLGKRKQLHEDALSLFKAASAIAIEKKCKDYANFNAGVALTIIGDSFAKKGQLKKAEQRFRKAVRLNSNFALAQQSYGQCLHMLGKKKKAEYHLKQALRLDAKDAKTHALYAMLLAESHRLREAVAHFEQATELQPSNSDFHTLLAMALTEENSYVDAEAEFKKAIALNPTSPIAHYHYGVFLGRLLRWSEAEKHFEKVFDANPSFENVKELYSASILQRQANMPGQPINEKWRWARRVYFENERPLDVEEFKLMESHEKEWKIIYDTFVCEMCGRCCRNTKWAVNLDTRLCWEDIERWRREGRSYILQYVLVFEGLGGDLIGPDGKFFSQCPFLKKEEGRKYSCLIHETKPKVCEVLPFYFHSQEECENCGQHVNKKDVYCRNCSMFLQVDPHALLTGCPGLRKALKTSGFYKPFHKFSITDLFSGTRDAFGKRNQEMNVSEQNSTRTKTRFQSRVD
jgi:tetratricopeptide (TPR) repeat protein